MLDKISRVADVLAIPFWILLFFYFMTIENKTIVEYILLFFAMMGLALDTVFSLDFIGA
jgi:hypothetical protein